ncbi:MAG: hypothetical protein P8M53_03985 [Pirellulales bacterium]|nr:hypothetical protein [Pirellulales bacterium]
MVGGNTWGSDIGTSLGDGGHLTLEFIDNAIGGSGDTDKDIWVFEIGGLPEELLIEISVDGSSWLDVGIADRVSATVDYGVGVDIDQYFTAGNGYDTSTRFRYVRATDTGNNFSTRQVLTSMRSRRSIRSVTKPRVCPNHRRCS